MEENVTIMTVLQELREFRTSVGKKMIDAGRKTISDGLIMKNVGYKMKKY